METVRCTITRIVYRSPAEEGEFFILAVQDVKNRQFTVKGTTTYLLETGQEIKVIGEMGEFKDQPQMTAGLISPVVPMTNDGAHGWIKALPIDGIGHERATHIRNAFPSSLDKALCSPEMLCNVEGVGKVLAERLVDAWACLDIPAEVLELFNKLDVPMHMVNKIFMACGGAQTMKICEENPWQLTHKVKGLGFKIADSIARSMGTDMESPERYLAAIDHVMAMDVEGNGHTQADANFILGRMKAMGLSEDRSISALGVVKKLSERKGMAFDRIYVDDLSGLYSITSSLLDEKYIARRLVEMLQAPNRFAERREFYQSAIAEVSEKIGIVLDPSQEAAALNCLCHPVSVITGGPGTGKSTTQKVILKVIQMEEEEDRTIRLVAPTGRASERLGEVTGHGGSTIHRALGFSFEGFERDESSPLDEVNFIADEFSMTDVGLAAAFIRALKPTSRLIIVGDDQQLPSVAAGQVLADLIRSGVIPVARLTVIHRQAEESGIIQAAHRTAKGLAPEANGRDVFMLEAADSAAIMRECRQLIEKRLPEMGFDPSVDMLLVTPQRKGIIGADTLNGVIKGYLNPEKQDSPMHSQKLGTRWWSIGDRVMHLKNDLNKGVMNGAIGTVVSVEPSRGEKTSAKIVVRYGKSHDVEYNSSDIKTLTHSWATTIHKVQGSEAPAVIHIVDATHEFMLERNLIYTGLTRAKNVLFFVGQQAALAKGCARTVAQRRKTGLCHMLRQAANIEPYILDSSLLEPLRLPPAPPNARHSSAVGVRRRRTVAPITAPANPM